MRRTCESKQLGWTAMLGLLLAAGSGCGGDSDGGGGSSGVTPSKPASEATDAEAKQLCEWVKDQVEGQTPSEQQLCTLAGASLTRTEADCKAFVTQCLEQPDDAGPGDGEELSCEDVSKDDFGDDCTATVGEIEACYRDLIAQQKKFFQDTSCADAGKLTEPEDPASCKKLATSCPEAFGDDSGDEFSCDGGASSYSEDDRCDDFPDCEDGADEQGC